MIIVAAQSSNRTVRRSSSNGSENMAGAEQLPISTACSDLTLTSPDEHSSVAPPSTVMSINLSSNKRTAMDPPEFKGIIEEETKIVSLESSNTPVSRGDSRSSENIAGPEQITLAKQSKEESKDLRMSHEERNLESALVAYKALKENEPSSSSYNRSMESMGEYDSQPADAVDGTIGTSCRDLVRADSKGRDVSRSLEEEGALVVRKPSSGDGGVLVVRRNLSSAEEGALVVRESSSDMHKGLDHCFVSVPCKERLSVLFATLRRNGERKIIVNCSSWESATYHAVLFRQLELLPVHELHESMADGDMDRAYDEFVHCYPGILFASDNAMREFDIPPNVDFVIQYEPPVIPTEYIYRMGNTMTYATSCYKALLFLTPDTSEMNFLKYFETSEVVINELQARRVDKFQERIEKLIMKHTELNEMAYGAFKAFKHGYKNHSFQDVFNYKEWDESGVRRSFAQPHFPGYSPYIKDGKDSVLSEGLETRTPSNRGNHHHHHRQSLKKSGTEGNAESSTKDYPWLAGKEKSSHKGHSDKDDSNKHHGKESGKEESIDHSKWMDGKVLSWRKNGQSKPWMTKEKTWKHCQIKTSTAKTSS